VERVVLTTLADGIRRLRDVPTIDFADASPILTEKQTAGEPQWLRVSLRRQTP